MKSCVETAGGQCRLLGSNYLAVSFASLASGAWTMALHNKARRRARLSGIAAAVE